MITFHIDPGHGWIEVGTSELRDVGLNPSDFSQYSYRQRNRFFLEEDCDACAFVAKYQAKHGKRPEFTEKLYNGPCFIRNLPSIRS